jgi:hypothetical protein
MGFSQFVFLSALFFSTAAFAGDFGVNVYGLSYHFERGRAKEHNLGNEFNPGLGGRYRATLNRSFDWFADAGVYHDSGRNTAVVAGSGLFWKASEGLRLGGGLTFFQSKSYNEGRAFVAPLPIIAYEWRAVTFNVAYVPRIRHVSAVNVLDFWLTFFPEKM